MPLAISISSLSKVYPLYNSPRDRLKEALHPMRKKYHHDFYALNDISFEVEKGETMGIIGQNGSGKSTLLKILSNVLTPTSGNVIVNGKVSSLLELGTGFNPELTGIENVYFNGTLLGFTRAEMDAKLDKILTFADIGEFVRQPVKNYSSGMYVRLAFAVAIHTDPDVLIVDEALSVGDVFFQQKCFNFIRELQNKGTTFVFVSHDTTAVQNVCDRAILLRNGHIAYYGYPEEAVSRYYATLGDASTAPVSKAIAGDYNRVLNENPAAESRFIDLKTTILENSIICQARARHGKGALSIIGAMLLNHRGQPSLSVEMLGTVRFIILFQANISVDEPCAGINIYDRFSTLIFAVGTMQLRKPIPSMEAGDMAIVEFQLTMNVQAGEYTFSLMCSEPSPDGPNLGIFHDQLDGLGPLQVFCLEKEIMPFYGIVQLPCEVGEVLLFKHE